MIHGGPKSALFLDRDGVLNSLIHAGDGSRRPPWSLGELQISSDAVQVLCDSTLTNWVKVVVTNQPDVSRGSLTNENLNRINESILREIPSINSFYVCPHDNVDGCFCRKPLPGLLTLAATELGLDLENSVMIGDRWVDIAAGKRAGTKTILINSDYSWTPSSSGSPLVGLKADFTIDSLRELLSITRQLA